MQAISKLMKKFEETGVVTNIKKPVHYRFARFAESVAKDPTVPIPRRSQELELPYGILWHLMHLDLHLHRYKVQLT